MFANKYDTVKLWKYAQEKNERICNFLKSINAMKADYIFVADNNGSPCITDRKQRTETDFKNIDASSKKFGIKSFPNTEHLNKSAFDDLKPKKFSSRIDFMSEILKLFCIERTSKYGQRKKVTASQERFFSITKNCQISATLTGFSLARRHIQDPPRCQKNS